MENLETLWDDAWKGREDVQVTMADYWAETVEDSKDARENPQPVDVGLFPDLATMWAARRISDLEDVQASYHQHIGDLTEDMNCLPECDGYGCAEGCPQADPQVAFDRLRTALNQIGRRVDRIRYAMDAALESDEVGRLLEMFDEETADYKFPEVDNDL